MQRTHAFNIRRITAFTLSLCFIVTVLLSGNTVRVIENHEHNCDSTRQETECKDFHKCCKICIHINDLNNLKSFIHNAEYICTPPVAPTLLSISKAVSRVGFHTLISLKTRLNN